jgi:hypothetical protein
MIRNSGRRRRARIVTAVLVGAVLAGAGACGDGDRTTTPESGPTVTPSASSTPGPSTPGPSSTGPSSTARRSAESQLASFFAGARRADTQLHRAAALINAGITADAVRIEPATVRAIEAVRPATLARKIPAGLDDGLLRPALLVYSEIKSRRMAMDPVTAAGDDVLVLPRSGPVDRYPSATDVLLALKNGGPAAVRFEADLANARALARSSPRFTVASPRSRDAAELAARVAYIDGANAGCAGTGGEIFPKLTDVRWTGGVAGRWWSGTVNRVGFRATYTGSYWAVSLNAC